MKNKIVILLATALLLLTVAANYATAQGTAFTYQGRLNQDGSPANGAYSMKFSLFDAPDAGNPLGDSLTNNPTMVSNGLFTVTLDFGSDIFLGSSQWLEIGVATNAGAGDFTPLTPRQLLTPTPYALHADTASDVLPGSVVKSVNTLKDDVTLAAGSNVTITPSGNTLTIDAAGAGGSGIWNLNGANTYYNAGNVGIGTTTPTNGFRLEVIGNAQVTTGGSGGTIQLGTPGGETGMAIKGANRADVRFDGSYLKLLAGIGPGAMSSQNGIAISSNGNVVVGLNSTDHISPAPKLLIHGDSVILGNAALNIQALSWTTMAIQPLPGNLDAFFVYDSGGQPLFELALSPHTLKMYGDALKNSGGTSWGTFSDRRLKQNVRGYEPGLEEVLQLRPVRFQYREDFKRGLTSNHEEVGFIAQEVREVIPDAVTEDKDGYLMLKADPIHWAAINAIKELNAKVAEQRTENLDLKKRLEKLERLLLRKDEVPQSGR